MLIRNRPFRTILHCSKCLILRHQNQGVGAVGLTFRGYSTKKESNSAQHWIQPEGFHTGIHVYNTLTKRKDELILPRGNNLSWYCCGPTVYDRGHVGHASSYMRFDIIRRILSNFFNINVTFMMGVTDVDDKIIKRANELEQEIDSITKHYEYQFFEELAMLNILPPTITSRVTGCIPEIIKFIQQIMDKGHGYVAEDGSVYFNIEEYGNYHQFRPKTEDSEAVQRVKKNAGDFALWKAVKPGEPYWDSPWGGGRPGWHIECSTMASEVFGSTLDIHSGGTDLTFPHHENELAQSCSYHGVKQWVNYWIHTGFLSKPFDAEKMSKSLKNVVHTSELLEKYTPNQFRMFCMKHYQSSLVYTESDLKEAVACDQIIRNFLSHCEAYIKGQIIGSDIPEAEYLELLAKLDERIMEALKNNFNVSHALDHLFNFISTISKGFKEKGENTESVRRSPSTIAACNVYVKKVCKKLGFQKPGISVGTGSADVKMHDIIDETVKFRWKVREFAKNADIPFPETMSKKEKRKAKAELFEELYKDCDILRSQFSHYKVFIQDRANTSTWDFADRTHDNPTESQQDQTQGQSSTEEKEGQTQGQSSPKEKEGQTQSQSSTEEKENQTQGQSSSDENIPPNNSQDKPS